MNPYTAMSNMELLESYHRKLKAYQPRQGQLQDIELMEKEILKRMVSKDDVCISKDEYESLHESVQKLHYLEVCGVDNWTGYGTAMEMLEELENQED